MNLFPDMNARDARINGILLGVVRDNRDPEARGRVKALIPALGDLVESGWAPVVTPNTGITFLPDLGDTVLLIFDHGDINRPYVIGAVQNGIKPPPYPNADGTNGQRVLMSRTGHTIRLDDTKGTIEIMDATGNMIILGNGAVKIFSAGEITLEGSSISLRASAAINIEAGASLDAKAGGTANIKGSQINLN